ncbi:hypothetical protein AB0F52_15145 [Amycolatopsis sp. NPDC024027]|uniref:hypothetical protein n=1 Tax=Amycolatopsis sp. NPDC024027 TaxID=3154327 RepID=UPI0033D10410
MTVSIMSRYRGHPVVNAPDSAGTPRPTVAIRRHTPPPTDAVDYQHRITGVEDIEYLAWRYYGNSEVWWRIADANPARFPLDLRPGDAVAVPASGRHELPSRERVF